MSRATGFGWLVAAMLAVSCHATACAAEPAGDAARGQRLFLLCRSCHTVERDAAHTVGPNLWGVVGAKAAAKPDFRYSPALAASGIVWTPDDLDRWLTRPTEVVAGTTMAFQGIASEGNRRDIIAYLETLRQTDGQSDPP